MAELQKLEEDLDDTYVILNNPEAMLDYSAKLKTFLRDEQPTSARRWLRTFLKRFVGVGRWLPAGTFPVQISYSTCPCLEVGGTVSVACSGSFILDVFAIY